MVVRPFETFDAVRAGLADMFHTHIGYYEKEITSLSLLFGRSPSA